MAKANEMTKKEVLNTVIAMVNGEEITEEGAQAILEYCNTTIAQMDAKNEKAKARKAEKPDPLMDAVKAALTAEFQTVDEIAATLNDPEVSANKIIARLTKLNKAGLIEKATVRVEKATKTTYRLVETESDGE